jgi:hypothetical protein
MKKIFISLMMTLACFISLSVKAENTSSVLLYIQPLEYNNEVRLQYFWQEYWFAQGPMVEPVAKEKLSKLYSNVSMCEGNDTGKILIWLQPRMFYNGQAKLFYGKITANVYTGLGKLINIYVAETKQFGSLDIAPDFSIKIAYAKAMDKIVDKMQADQQLHDIVNKVTSGDTPCSMVTLLPTPKIRTFGF